VNFGTILDSVTKQCLIGVANGREKESKKLARSFSDYIHLKEALRKQFYVYYQLNTAFIKNRNTAEMFVKEVFNTLKEFNFDDIKTYNAILETKFPSPKIKSTPLNQSIAEVIRYMTSVCGQNQKSYVEALETIVDSVVKDKLTPTETVERMTEEIANSELKFLTPRHVVKIALNKFNKKYSDAFNDEDKKVFFTLKGGVVEDIEHMHSEYIGEAMELSHNAAIPSEFVHKIEKCVHVCSEAITNDTILDVYDLVCELRDLTNEEVNNG